MFVADSYGLDELDEALRLLDEAKSLTEIKAIRDKAEAARAYARAARLGLEYQNRAAALKLRAERRAGRFLASLKLRGGDRRSKERRSTLKLADMGVSRAESKRWQQLASVAETTFCDYLAAMNRQLREITATGLLRLVRAQRVGPLCTSFWSDCDMGTTNGGQLAHDATVLELANHFRLLTEVLRPVYAGGNLRLVHPEVRLVGQLLSEMGELIRQLTGSGHLPA